MSDSHNLHNQVEVPECDILIHAGDFTLEGKGYEIEAFAEWINAQTQAKHKVVVAGNHDWLFERKPEVARYLLGSDIIYLRDEEATVAGLRIYGSPVQPTFFDWAFNVNRGPDIKKYWDKIPEGLDILITHGPPMGILDSSSPEGSHVGCYDLVCQIEAVKPKVHVFGHIHGGYGFREYRGIKFYNASVVDESYRVKNKPWVLEL